MAAKNPGIAGSTAHKPLSLEGSWVMLTAVVLITLVAVIAAASAAPAPVPVRVRVTDRRR